MLLVLSLKCSVLHACISGLKFIIYNFLFIFIVYHLFALSHDRCPEEVGVLMVLKVFYLARLHDWLLGVCGVFLVYYKIEKGGD